MRDKDGYFAQVYSLQLKYQDGSFHTWTVDDLVKLGFKNCQAPKTIMTIKEVLEKLAKFMNIDKSAIEIIQ